MEYLSREAVIQTVDDPHKVRILNKAQKFFRFTIESPELLYSLIMHYHKRSECLTPSAGFGLIKKTWTIGRVVDRMLAEGIRFEDLAAGKDPRVPESERFWFERFIPLLEGFDYKKLPPLLLFNPNNQEQKDCPDGAFKLIDGMHRGLVLTYLLKTDQIEFSPIEAILLTPRVYKY